MQRDATIQKAHGSGGRYTHDLIRNLFGRYFDNAPLKQYGDSAVLDKLQGRLVFTTDSHVVKPLFFPGGDIGKLAVTGTVNDLAVAGAKPLWLSCGMIIEEGFSIATLEQIVKSMRQAADSAGVYIVTGDTKVVGHGEADGIYISTAGVGELPEGLDLTPEKIAPGDCVLVSGFIGDHEAAIIKARHSFKMEMEIESDCAAVHELTARLVSNIPSLRIMRDPTRGGLATTLNEFVFERPFGIRIFEDRIPVRDVVKGICEPLGYEPWYLANEGKIVVITGRDEAQKVLDILQEHPLGRDAVLIGEVVAEPRGRVLLHTLIGTDRILDMLSGTMLPRIC